MFSLFRYLSKRFGTTIYIQIWENRIKAVNLSSGHILEQKPLVAVATRSSGRRGIIAVGDDASALGGRDVIVINPFSHPRSLFKDFFVAEKLVQSVIKVVLGGKIISLAPCLIVHPMEKLDGGLTSIERRAFTELGIGAGACETVVFEGDALAASEIDFEEIKKRFGE